MLNEVWESDVIVYDKLKVCVVYIYMNVCLFIGVYDVVFFWSMD